MSSRATIQRRVYHVRFASHLLNTYGPNQLYPELGLRWSDEEWFRHLQMIQAFGYNVFQFALEPRLCAPDAHQTEYGKAFYKQMAAVTTHARSIGLETCLLAPLAPASLCPADPEEWTRIRSLWSSWLTLLPQLTSVAIAPGEGCARNGCTARTFIDRALLLADLVSRQLPKAFVEVHTWGPPFLGWGAKGWKTDRARADDALGYLVKKLPELPPGSIVALNLGLNPEGAPDGGAGAWAREIAKTARVVTWDPSPEEEEEPVLPRYGLERIYGRRKAEREAGPYAGGLYSTCTPTLNQLGAFAAARSFMTPEDNGNETARSFLQGIFGTQGRAVAEGLPLFDHPAELPRGDVKKRMALLLDLLSSLKARSHGPFHPDPENWRKELVFFARLCRDLADLTPDYDELHQRYWYHVYRIHDRHPDGVDPRPAELARKLIQRFRELGS